MGWTTLYHPFFIPLCLPSQRIVWAGTYTSIIVWQEPFMLSNNMVKHSNPHSLFQIKRNNSNFWINNVLNLQSFDCFEKIELFSCRKHLCAVNTVFTIVNATDLLITTSSKFLSQMNKKIHKLLKQQTQKICFFKELVIHTINSSKLSAVLHVYQKWLTMSFDHVWSSLQFFSCPACKLKSPLFKKINEASQKSLSYQFLQLLSVCEYAIDKCINKNFQNRHYDDNYKE